MADADVPPTRIAKVLARLESDHAGEVRAAAHALHRLLHADQAARGAEHRELEACLDYAAAAIGALAREIEALRRDNRALRAQASRPDAPAPWPESGRLPRGHDHPVPATAH